MRRLEVLALTYPLARVEARASGGTEQIAHLLLRGMREKPYRNAFRVRQFQCPPAGRGPFTDRQLSEIERNNDLAAAALIVSRPELDLIHNQGASFYLHAARVKRPVLMTVHLARSLYPPDWLDRCADNVFLQCVSATEHRRYAADPRLGAAGGCRLTGWIGNGIDLSIFRPGGHRRDHSAQAPLLFLGRICEEKGAHLAIAIARSCRRQLYLVGATFPFPSHRRYFAEKILPHLDDRIRWLPPPSVARKLRLLQSAAAVLVPSLIDETSSLTAMEAAACGTPVLALNRGALAEIVQHERTGFVVSSWPEMATAVGHLDQISSEDCRRYAEARFCSRRMIAEYASLYRRLS